MNHSYQPEDKEFFDYQIYQYKNWLLRGPKPDLTKPYICFIGAAQTFGRYCQRPFVHQVSQHLGIPAMNFGIAGADPSYFLKDDIISCANESVLTVFQVLSARSCTNSLFTNKSGCREGFAYGQPMVSNNFWAKGQDVKIVQESQDQYIKTMKKLFTLVRGKKVLFWISTRQPKHNTSYQTLSNIFPHFVNKNVIDNLVSSVDEYIECSTNDGMPQIISDNVTNSYYPSPEMHKKAAESMLNSNYITNLKYKYIPYA